MEYYSCINIYCITDNRGKHRPKHKACGRCLNCKRVENCGLCLGCNEMKRFGSSDLCENRKCLNANVLVTCFNYYLIIIMFNVLSLIIGEQIVI